jgi:hypothetical protein
LLYFFNQLQGYVDYVALVSNTLIIVVMTQPVVFTRATKRMIIHSHQNFLFMMKFLIMTAVGAVVAEECACEIDLIAR